MKLFPHQQEALEQTKGLQNVGFFHDMGLGKTFTGSEAMIRFKTDVNLIVCQKSKVQDWIDHLEKHYSEHFRLIWDCTEFKKADWEVMIQAIYPPCVMVINYELAWRRKELLKLQDFTLMLDESSLIQNHKAKQTKFILKLHPAHVILLSGTPVGGKYENLWTQCHLLGWKISEHAFNNTYINWTTIDVGGVKHKIVDKADPYKNTDILKKKMRKHGSVFLKTEEVLNLPEQIFTTVKVEPVKEYWKFRKNAVVTVEGLELVGDTTLTKLLYERQLCGQYNKNKLDAFRDLIQSTQERLIVFYNFNEELFRLKQICQQEGRPISEINGHVKDLSAYEQESNSITLCQYQSASKGLNLQEANRIIYFTLPLSSEHFEQSKKRIHRIGQKKTCFYYLLICKGTVEEQILKTLEERKDYTDELYKEDKKDQEEDPQNRGEDLHNC